MYDETDFFETVFSWFKLSEKNYDRFDVNMCKQELSRMLTVNEEEITEIMENKAEEQYFNELDDAKEEARDEAYDDCKEEFSDAIRKYVDKKVDILMKDKENAEEFTLWDKIQAKLDEILDYADRHVDSY